ncbi:MAG: GNAT family N-acetyltransferase [Thermoguttaceae bacterium]
MAYITRPGHETWVAHLRGTPVGYFELDGEAGGGIELAYFGILPQFTGQVIGGYLLTFAIQRAWEKDAVRVWLHTSSFDHPQALKNYLARGFQIVKRKRARRSFPASCPARGLGRIAQMDIYRCEDSGRRTRKICDVVPRHDPAY